MKAFIGFFYVLPVLLCFGCNNGKVVSFNNPDLAGNQYKSYYLITRPAETSTGPEQEMVTTLSDRLEQEMKDRNLSEDNKDPDLILRYKFYGAPNTTTYPLRTTDRYYNSYRIPDYYNTDSQSTESILLIELHDRRRKKLLWQGSVDLNYRNNRKTNNTEQFLEGITRILETLNLSSKYQ